MTNEVTTFWEPPAGVPDPERARQVVDTMATARSIRRFRPDPVPTELIEAVVFAATRASSGRNSQPWEYIAIRDRTALDSLAAAFQPRVDELIAARDRTRDAHRRTMFQQAATLMQSFGHIPVVIVVAGHRYDWGPPFDPEETMLSALFAASQNLLVAARSMGLGAAFTTFHLHAEPLVRELTGLAPEMHIATTMPVGWPEQSFGPVRRLPVSDVLHWDRYEDRQRGQVS